MHIPDSPNHTPVNPASSEKSGKVVNEHSSDAIRTTRVDTGGSINSPERSAELTLLVQQLQESPVIRHDVVALASSNLADGTYTTRAATERTAIAILGAKATE